MPERDIEKIQRTSHGRGALHGLAIGAGIGATVGIVAGYASGDDDCDEDLGLCIFDEAEDKAFVGGMLLGTAGGLVGLVIGAAMGATITYEHDRPRQVVKPVGPPGSVAGVSVSF